MALNEKIEARRQGVDSAGFGLFAREELAQGEWIWRRDADEPEYSLGEIRTWPAEIQKAFFRNAYQVGPDRYHGPASGVVTDPADYMNHGCDPNCWFETDELMTARRPIAAGEEILYDYATSELQAGYRLDCLCGSPLCRGTIRGGELLADPELRARYGDHVMSHLKSAGAAR